MRSVKWLAMLFLFHFLGSSTPADGATIQAASCSQAAVAGAVSSARDGDTVVIPAGTCNWTANLTIANKFLTIQGAGIGQTTIVDNVPRVNGQPQLVSWTTKDGGLSRLTGITFQGGTTPDGFNSGIVRVDGTSHQLRIDHCRFVPTQTSGLMLYGYLWGVIDHNIFDVSSGTGFGMYIFHTSWNVPGSDFGDASWADNTSMGTNQAMFVEDNTFTNNQSVQPQQYAMDGWSGSRVVYRFNTYTNTTWANHGTESSGRWRSQRQYEVYNNTFSLAGPVGFPSFLGSRGGVGVVYNNVATTSGGASVQSFADLVYYRATQGFNPWGQCGGSIWDGRLQANGYPCLDQTGFGKGLLLSNFDPAPIGWPVQAAEPTYSWNNTLNGQVSPMVSNTPSIVASGRDFFNSPKPGYTPYVYPHPLAGGAASPAPISPQNVSLQ